LVFFFVKESEKKNLCFLVNERGKTMIFFGVLIEERWKNIKKL